MPSRVISVWLNQSRNSRWLNSRRGDGDGGQRLLVEGRQRMVDEFAQPGATPQAHHIGGGDGVAGALSARLSHNCIQTTSHCTGSMAQAGSHRARRRGSSGADC